MRAFRLDKNGKPHISEKAFTAQVISLARHLGWKVAHFRPAMDSKGRWKTAVQGDGVGFLDLILLRRNKLKIAELKVGNGKLTAEQTLWFATWVELSLWQPGIDVYLWRPSDYDEIERILR